MPFYLYLRREMYSVLLFTTVSMQVLTDPEKLNGNIRVWQSFLTYTQEKLTKYFSSKES